MSSIKYGILPLETVEHLILRIEADQAFVHGKSVDELIEDGEMPDIYFELIAAKKNAWTLKSLEQNYAEGVSKMNLSRDSNMRLA